MKPPPRTQINTKILGVTVRSAHKPENNHGFHKHFLIILGIVTAFEQCENVTDAWTPVRFVFQSWRHRQGLAAVFLGESKETSIAGPEAIKALDHENALATQFHHVRLGGGQAKRCCELHA